MPKSIYKIIFQMAAILFFAITAFAQNQSDASVKTSKNAVSSLYEFSLAASKDTFQIGEDIDITLTLKNDDGQTVIYWIDRYHQFKYYKITLQTTDGKSVAQSAKIKDDGNPEIGSGMSFDIPPQETLEQKLRLTNLYELGNGKYRLTISREIRTQYSFEKIEITTNQIDFEVTEKLSSNL